ncbi:MAG: T9SS type A sorting domain-containing protein [Flavobacteriales bacterium]|nr:T9SS type A sorting domain-containing protein [Flavobacteriales bacterium]
MKKLLFLSLNIFISLGVTAQGTTQGTIGIFQWAPLQPTTNDTVFIFADVQFSSSDCELLSSSSSVVGNTIMANAHHCLGLLTAMCYTTDTFVVPPLAAGTYTFDLTLTSGFGSGPGTPPCTPGIVPDDNQDFQFTVSSTSSPCNLVGVQVAIPFPASPIMMNATVNGMSQYTYAWNDGTPVGSSNQKPFYSGWCVTITDLQTGCDTTICESCIPTGGFGVCPLTYMPVCGCDGNIYNNDCIAMQNGIFTYTSAIGPNGQLLPCPQTTACEVEIIGDSVICNSGSSTTLLASPTTTSNPFVSYLWSNGAIGSFIIVTAAGTYCVLATDSTGCTDSACFTVSIGEIDIFSSVNPAIICDGDSIVLEIDAYYTSIVWSTNDTTNRIVVTPSINTSYVVEAIDSNGCAARGELTVDVFTSPNLTIYSAPNPPYLCLGDSIVLEATAGFVSYAWNNGMIGDRIVDFPGQDTWYLLEAIDSNGCVVREDIWVYVDTCTSSINDLFENKVMIYPNPTSGKINIDLPNNEKFDIQIFEINGKLIESWNDVTNQLTINNSLNKGVYIIKIKEQDFINNFKLIKK